MKRTNHVQPTRNKFFRGIHAMVLHHVPTHTQTNIQPRRIPQPRLTYSAGKILSAIGLGAVVLAATASSAGAYSSGSADYGTLLAALNTANSNAKPDTTVPTGYQAGTWGLTGGVDEEIAAELGPWSAPGVGTPIPSYFSTGENRSVFFQPGYTGTTPMSVFHWTKRASGSAASVNRGVFDDINGYSVFESPNGNSYTSWLPFTAQSVGYETPGSTNWQSASSSAYLPYSVFKDQWGNSVFTDPNGNSYLSQIYFLAHAANTPEIGSVFSTGRGTAQRSVFQYQGYETVPGTGYGTTNDSSGYPEPMFSDFEAGTGTNSGNGPSGIGSVFVTDDPTIGNVQNSVFLDPYGNSYLDDMTASLTLPMNGMSGNPTTAGGAGGTKYVEAYNRQGVLTLNGPLTSGDAGNQYPLGLAQLIAYSQGITWDSNYATTMSLTTPYPYLTEQTFENSPGETLYNWYTGYIGNTGSYQNMFARAFYNPPTSATQNTLTPYLSELGGWKDSPGGQLNFTDAQTSLQQTIGNQNTTLQQYVAANAPATPAAATPTTALQGTFATTWQLPVNQISQSFGILTDSIPADSTAIQGQGYAKDNTSLEALKAIQNLMTLSNPSNTLQVPQTELSPSTNGGSTLLASQMNTISPQDATQTAGQTSFLSGQTPFADNITDTAGTSSIGTGQTAAIILDPENATINAYMTGFVDGMQWFRSQFAWLAQILGWLLELLTMMKCWDLIHWGIAGGPFPLDISLKRPTPKHDTVEKQGDGRNSPLNTADNYGRVAKEIGPYITGTEQLAETTAADAAEMAVIA